MTTALQFYVYMQKPSSLSPFMQRSPFFPAGESVEENANVVVRLLIRRPECFGPALRGEGGNGLLAAIEEAIQISQDPARDGPTVKKDRRRELCVKGGARELCMLTGRAGSLSNLGGQGIELTDTFQGCRPHP